MTNQAPSILRRLALTLTAVGFAALALGGCAPSPEDVCEHMIELAEKEGVPMGGDEGKKACVESVEKEKEMTGYFDYRSQANCIMDAGSFEDALKCDKEE